MTTFGSYQKPKNRCGSRLFWFSHCLKPNEKYRLGSKTPKTANLRQKVGDFYFFTINYSLSLMNSEYVFLGYNLILTHPYGHNEPTEADL